MTATTSHNDVGFFVGGLGGGCGGTLMFSNHNSNPIQLMTVTHGVPI